MRPEFPGFERIYSLRDPLASRPLRADLELKGAVAALCGQVRPASPVLARWAMGSAVPMDIVWTTNAGILLISDRVVELLSQRGFTGWSTYPVRLTGRRGEELPPYHGLVITGRCGDLDPSRRMAAPKEYPTGLYAVWLGLYFDPDSWDGSDFFMAQQGRWILVVSEVKKAFESAKIKNLQFTPLPEIEQSI